MRTDGNPTEPSPENKRHAPVFPNWTSRSFSWPVSLCVMGHYREEKWLCVAFFDNPVVFLVMLDVTHCNSAMNSSILQRKKNLSTSTGLCKLIVFKADPRHFYKLKRIQVDWGSIWAVKWWRIAGQIKLFRDLGLFPSETSESWSHKTCSKIKNIHLSKFLFSQVDAEFSWESIHISISFSSKK